MYLVKTRENNTYKHTIVPGSNSITKNDASEIYIYIYMYLYSIDTKDTVFYTS